MLSSPNQVKTRPSWQTLKITGFKWKTLRPFRQKGFWNFFLFRDQSAKSFRSWALSNQIILSVCRFLSCHFWQIKLRQDNLRVKGVRHIWYVLTSWLLMLTIWTSWLRSSPWHNYFRSDPLLQFANGRQTVTTPGRNKTHTYDVSQLDHLFTS